jgi:hypothetical protein
MRLVALALCLVVLPALAAAAERIALAEARGPAGVSCPRAEGAFVAFLVPARGSLLLATQPFPGGRRVGTIEGRRLRVSVDGLGDYELETASEAAEPLPVWGMLDRSLDIGQRTGCFSFGRRDFSSVDDLKTYLHWVLRDLFFRLRAADNAEPLGLRLADRQVSLEISTPGHRAVTLQTREAGTIGLRLPDSESVYYFQPFVLDEVRGTLAVKVLLKDRPFFGEGVAREVAFVTAGREAPGVTATEPLLEIRTLAID